MDKKQIQFATLLQVLKDRGILKPTDLSKVVSVECLITFLVGNGYIEDGAVQEEMDKVIALIKDIVETVRDGTVIEETTRQRLRERCGLKYAGIWEFLDKSVKERTNLGTGRL